MKIYWFKAQAPRRVLALAKYLGLTFESIELDMMGGDLKADSYRQLNPNKKAPTLVDGEIILWESSAIMAYLCNKVGSDLWPAQNPTEQVEVLKWLSWNDCHWGPEVAYFYFEHVIKTTYGFSSPDRELLKGRVAPFTRFAEVLNDHLAGKSFVACGRLTIADFQLASMASYWKEAEMPLEKFSNITRWLENLSQIPAWENPWP